MELAAADAGRADQVIADLEFVLVARDQFPVALLRAARQGLARSYRVLGRQQEAAEALRRSGGPSREGPNADVHRFLADRAGRASTVGTAHARPRPERARRPVLRLQRLRVHRDNRRSRRDRRW